MAFCPNIIERNPVLAAVVILVILGLVGSIDLAAQEKEASNDAAVRAELAQLCRMDWPAGNEKAKQRACKPRVRT